MTIRPPPWLWRLTHIRVFPLLRFLPVKWYMLDTFEPASLLPDGSFYLAQKKLKIGVDAEGKLTLQRGKYHDRTKGFAAEGRLAVVEEVSRRDFAAAEERNGLAWKRATERHLAEQRAQATEERSEEHTSELQSLMRISYAVFCLKKQKPTLQQCY